MNIGAVILAGGESKRMGKIKALLPVQEVPMLRLLAERVLDTSYHPLVVVLGAYRQQILPVLEKMPIGVIENQTWEHGLGTSIRMGLVGSYMITKGIDALLFLSVDMPTVHADDLSRLVDAAQANEDAEIVWTKGTYFPFLVKSSSFEALLDLNGDDALACLERLPSHIVDSTPHPDLNTEEEYLDHLKNASL